MSPWLVPPTPVDILYQKGHKGSLMGTCFPQPNYQQKLPYPISFQCPLMSNHEIYDIGTKILYETCFVHNSTQKASPEELQVRIVMNCCLESEFNTISILYYFSKYMTLGPKFYTKLVSSITRRRKHLHRIYRCGS